MMSDTKPTLVLVHGAWADGSSWAPVIALLQDTGFHTVAAPLPLTGLADDIAALARVVERIQGEVILVAHAYAGAVIGGLDDQKVRGLVFVAALAPDAGETVAEIFNRDTAHPLAPKIGPDAGGWIWMPENDFAKAFAHRAEPAQARLLAAVQRPIALACIQAPAPAPAWRGKPSWFLVAQADRMIPSQTQIFLAERMGATVRIEDLDHTPLITAPDRVVNIILAAAGHA